MELSQAMGGFVLRRLSREWISRFHDNGWGRATDVIGLWRAVTVYFITACQIVPIRRHASYPSYLTIHCTQVTFRVEVTFVSFV